jgi:DNA invertase Pin-like site-specific DNA recombinase
VSISFIRDRQRAGIEAAKAKGIYKGRPATFDRARIVALRKEGMGATEIAEAVGCKRGNVYKALKAVVPSALIAPNLIPRRRSQDASARQCDVGS